MNISTNVRKFFAVGDRRLVIVGAVVLSAVVHGYYRDYFSGPIRFLWVAAFVLLVVAHLWAGGRLFVAGRPAPWVKLLLFAGLFSTLRWAYAYFVLQHYLPANTVFHNPGRAMWFIVPTSVFLVLAGYGRRMYQRHLRPEPPPDSAASLLHNAILTFRSEGKDIRLPVAELIYVKAQGEYVIYCCADRRYPRFQRLKEASQELRPYGIVRIHRSYLVASAAVRTMDGRSVELVDGTKLPVSRTYREVLSAATS